MRLLTLLILLLTLPLSTEAAKPSRRALIQQGEQHLEDSMNVKLQNAQQGVTIEYDRKTIPLLNISFERPAREDEKDEDWSVHNYTDDTSSYSRRKIGDGDYIVLTEDRHEETYAIFIYSKEVGKLATIEDTRAEWERIQRQPDHDNVYEYSNLAYIRELNVIRTDDYEYLGKPALYIEYTFSNWSKFWTETKVMFPHGNRIYTIMYRRERDVEDKFYEVYKHVLDTFTFLTGEPVYSPFRDVSGSHPYAKAIERLKNLDIVGGYSDGTFKPDATINRAEFVKILTSEPLVNATELATCDTSQLTFSDVPAGIWYEKYLCIAVQRGMIAGYPDGTFKGGNSILFAEAAKIVATFFAQTPIGPSSGEWYEPFINFLASRSAIPKALSSPSTPLSRGAMAEIINRLY